MVNGWIKLSRSIQSHWVWECEFSYGQAWVDLLMMACHTETKFTVKGQIITLKRGQIGKSEVTLSGRWKWSRGKVRRFLKHLENDSMIEQKATHLTSIITICNYDIFQCGDTADGTTDGQQTVQQTDSRRYTNKNVKNEKNVKNDLFGSASEPVTPKKRSKKKALTDFPADFFVDEEMSKWYFEQDGFVLDLGEATQSWADGVRAKGYQYADWKMAWRNGVKNQNKWAKERMPK